MARSRVLRLAVGLAGGALLAAALFTLWGGALALAATWPALAIVAAATGRQVAPSDDAGNLAALALASLPFLAAGGLAAERRPLLAAGLAGGVVAASGVLVLAAVLTGGLSLGF